MEKPIHVKPALYSYYFEQLKVIAKELGYNLIVHGSMNRDLDLIAIPWIDNPEDEFKMIQQFEDYLNGFHSEHKDNYSFTILPGGRKNYVINLNRVGVWNTYIDAQYYLDISVTPLPS